MNSDPEQIESVLVALADPTRRKLLGALAEEGSASASRLAGRVPVSRQAVVKHLHLLEEAGLVSSGRSGREVLFQVETSALTASVRWMTDLAATWDRRLEVLKRAAEEPDASR